MWSMVDLNQIVNTDLYPVTDQDSQALQQLIAGIRRRLECEGVALLPKFMREEAIERTVDDATQASRTAYRSANQHGLYLEETDGTEWPADHARSLQVNSSKTCVTFDQIGDASPLRQLYLSDAITELVRQLLGRRGGLYRTADPLGALNVHLYGEGDRLGWHFDRGQFAVTLMLQEPNGGGVFEYVPSIRSDQDENYQKVRRVVLQSCSAEGEGVRQVRLQAGTLMLFCGRNSLHRVTRVEGGRQRVLAVLSYEDRPGVLLNEYTRKKFYGRLN